MLKLSKTVEYALISLNHISQADTNSPITVRYISDRYNIPYELLKHHIPVVFTSKFGSSKPV